MYTMYYYANYFISPSPTHPISNFYDCYTGTSNYLKLESVELDELFSENHCSMDSSDMHMLYLC